MTKPGLPYSGTMVQLGQLVHIGTLLRELCVMNWTGTWRNQYGSILRITDDDDGLVKGVFKTALQNSAFFGHELPVTGIWLDDCINFAFGTPSEAPTSICSFTGMLRENKLQTVWHVVTSAKVEK
jgi:hypothetical protein